MALREEAQRGQVPFFIASHRKSWHRHDVTRDVSLELLAEQCCQVSPPWNYAPPFPFCSLEGSYHVQHAHKGWEVMLHLLEDRAST